MLLPYTTLTYHGPGAGAAVEPPNQPTAEATLKGLGALRSAHTTAPTASARINDGRQLRAVHTTAPTAYARPAGKGRLRAIGKVNELSQDDVTGAVLESEIEPGVTVKKALRALLSISQGLTTITDTGGGSATVRFRDFNDTKDRLVFTMDESERVGVSRDLD
jgi:hypothetical protein